VLDPFPERGTEAQTVAVLAGARSIRAPFSPSFVQFPEHRPYAAFDGDPTTWWRAESNFDDDRRWIEIDFGRRLDVPAIELLPQREARTELRKARIGGREFDLRPGWNRLPVGLRDAERLRIEIAGVEGPPPSRTRGPGAIAEVRIPGVRVRERLRPPQVATRALAGADLGRTPLTLLFERTTGDDPFHRDPSPDPDATSVPAGDNQSAALVAAAGDGERRIARRIELPAARAWRADGWVSVAPGRHVEALRRFAGPQGRIAAPCGAGRARAAIPGRGRAVVLTMRLRGSVSDLRAGRPLRAVACGPAVTLPAGVALLRAGGGVLRVDLLRMRSPAPDPVVAPVAPGRVLDPGSEGRGERDGVRVALAGPAWLVLAESFNRGWRAECDGRDLGDPRPIDGFANGWRAPGDCRDVSFRFGPQRAMDVGFAVSALACILLLVLLVVAARRRRGQRPPRASAEAIEPRPTRRLTLGWALAAGTVAAAVGGFLFALRAGVVIGPAVALVLWRGLGAAPLALAAGVLTAVVLPAIYLIFPPDGDGGFNSEYASDLLGAHWVAVAVWVLLALALSRAIPRRPAAAPPGAGAGSAAP
jgi:hypothetical protein